MKQLPHIIIYFGFILCVFNTLKGQVSFKQIDVSNGLSQNSVVSITQDSDGFLWFATQDGLNRYSGNFKLYQKQFDDITRQDFYRLGNVYNDKNGKVWIITKSGNLEYLNKNTNSFITSEKIENVVLLSQDNSRRYWITTENGEILNADPDFENIDTIFSQDNLEFFDLKEIDNDILIASSDGVLVFNNSNGVFLKNQLLKGSKISSIDCNNESIYYGTFNNGLFLSNFEYDQFVKHSKVSTSSVIYKVLCDKKNRTWVGTYGEGLILLSSKSTIDIFKPKIYGVGQISYHDVLDIYEDVSGVIWIGTDGGGINYYDEYIQKFSAQTIKSVPSNINIDVVRSIYADEHKMYIGTSGKGLTVFDKRNKKWSTYTIENGLNSNRIMALEKDSNDDLWIGSQFNGLSIVKGIHDNHLNVDTFLNGKTIWSFERNKPSEFWCGTHESGIYLFHKNKGVVSNTILYNDDNKTVSIRCLVRVNEKEIFIGTDNDGVFLFNTIDYSYRNIPLGENQNAKVKSMLLNNGALLIGTNGSGMYSIDVDDYGLIQHLTSDTGLSNNVIYGIESGGDNDIWISTNRGLSRLIQSNDKLTVKRDFSLDDGLQSFEFNTGAHFKSNDGTIYFGGINGINWFNPDSIPFNLIEPKILISDFKIMGKTYSGPMSEISIPYNQNNFTFNLATTQLSMPNRNKYKYKLIDFETDWKESNSNQISYMNIKPGRYIFEAIGANYDGTWSENAIRQVISIKQVWYFSWWFRSLMALVLLYLLFVIWYLKRKRLILMHQTEQQKFQSDYLQSINDTRSRLFTNITHELLTPLTVIKGLSRRVDGNEKLKIKIARNTDQLINLVNQVLTISKTEHGFIKYEPYLMNVIPYLKYLSDSYSSIAADKHISLNFYTEFDSIVMDVDPDKLKTVLGNVVMNAIKYTPMYGKVMVVVKKNSDTLYVSVNDNGIGMDELTKENIFNRFYQSGQLSEGGVGVGLSIVKELCDIMDVDIKVNSTPNKGTEFNLEFKISAVAEPLSDFYSNQNNNLSEQLNGVESDNSNSFSAIAKSILLVEDNNDVADYIMQVLSLSYNCIHARNGKEALDYAKINIPDIVITDVMMPVMDGISLVIALKSELSTSHIPVIILTAKNLEKDKLIALQSGAIAFLTKPFSEAELLIRIDSLLAEQERYQLRFGEKSKISKIEEAVETDGFLKLIIETIDSNIDNENLSIQDLCETVNLERTQVYRKLKALTGKSASQMIKERRLKKAYALIEDRKLSISEIAYACGYKDVSYFSKSFKKYFNINPSDV